MGSIVRLESIEARLQCDKAPLFLMSLVRTERTVLEDLLGPLDPPFEGLDSQHLAFPVAVDSTFQGDACSIELACGDLESLEELALQVRKPAPACSRAKRVRSTRPIRAAYPHNSSLAG